MKAFRLSGRVVDILNLKTMIKIFFDKTERAGRLGNFGVIYTNT